MKGIGGQARSAFNLATIYLFLFFYYYFAATRLPFSDLSHGEQGSNAGPWSWRASEVDYDPRGKKINLETLMANLGKM